MADKPKMTEEMELPPGVVVTPGYEAPAKTENVGGFADRRIIVHEDNDARMAERAKYFRAEVADHPIASTYQAAGRSEQAKPAASKA